MPVLPKPSTKTDWTVGNPNFGTVTVEPTSGKKLTGWTAGEKPPHQTMNWVHYITDQWIDYLESITDDHETRIDTLETTVIGLGQAVNITASNAGHTYATGANVQVQLDQLDTFLETLADAVTNGQGADLLGYVVGTPTDWDATIPDHVGNALDQLASRLRVVENATNIADYLDGSFNDYCIPADDPVNGGGNAGFTDTLATNPRQLKFAENQVLFGEERLEILDCKLTGKFDSNGLPEWAVWTQKGFDKRVVLYGTGWGLAQGVSGAFVYTPTLGDYVLATGIMDGLGILTGSGSGASNNIDIQKNTVDTGVNFSFREAGVLGNKGTREASIYSDPTMQNLTRDLMTWKIVNGSSDGFTEFYLQGLVFINTVPLDVGGKMFLQKNIVTLAKQNITPASVGAKGGVVYRYVDRLDQTRKEVVAEPELVETTSPSIGAGAITIGVVSTTGFQAGDLILLKDSAAAELLRISSVGVGTLTFSTVTVYGYTAATVRLYGRTFAGGALTHANEKVKNLRNYKAFGDSNNSGDIDTQIISAVFSNLRGDYTCDDGCSRVAASDGIGGTFTRARGLSAFTNDRDLLYEFVGTGLDVLFDTGPTITGTVKVLIDNVDCGNISLNTNSFFWKNVVSDLPWGYHSVIFRYSVAGSVNGGIVAFKEFEPKLPTVIANLAKGDLLAKRAVCGEYIFLDPIGTVLGGYYVQPGTIRQNLAKHAYFINGTGGTTDWTQQLEGATTRFSYATGRAYATDRTNGKLVFWFFGKGITISGRVDTSHGISQVKIDGNNANTGNFPSAVFKYSAGGGSFAAGTGLWDQYHTTALEAQRLSIHNLTEGWHKLEIENTGTKNGSSSGFLLHLAQVEIHAMPFWGDVAQYSVIHPMLSVNYGGVMDTRRVDPNSPNNDERFLSKQAGELGGVGALNYSTSSSNPFPMGRCNLPFKSNGGIVEFNFNLQFKNTVESGSYVIYLYLDDLLIYAHEETVDRPNYIEQLNFSGVLSEVSAGEHFAWVEFNIGSGTGSAFKRQLSVKEHLERRAL